MAEKTGVQIPKLVKRSTEGQAVALNEAGRKNYNVEELQPVDPEYLTKCTFYVYLMLYLLADKVTVGKSVQKVLRLGGKEEETFQKLQYMIRIFTRGLMYKILQKFVDTHFGTTAEEFVDTIRETWEIFVHAYIDKITVPSYVEIETMADPGRMHQLTKTAFTLISQSTAKIGGNSIDIYKYKIALLPITDFKVTGIGMSVREAVKRVRQEYPDFNVHTSLYSLGKSLAGNPDEDIVAIDGYVVFPASRIPLFAVRTSEKTDSILFLEGVDSQEAITQKGSLVMTALKCIYRDEIGVKFVDVRPELLLNWMLNPETQYGASRRFRTVKATRASLRDNYYIEINIDSNNTAKGSYKVTDYINGRERILAQGTDA